ncbi:MAG: hypothetical protein HQ483_07720 [Rhodospirillales bacterium]|nr:hypothetical protein [Rhodospirillales bacterium]
MQKRIAVIVISLGIWGSLVSAPAYATSHAMQQIEGKVTTALDKAEGVVEEAVNSAGSMWDYFTGLFSASAFSPPTPMSSIRDMHHPDGSPFWGFLEDAGYKFKEVVTDVGIIPGVSFEFVIARELSEADRNSLERALEINAKRHPDIISALQRRIVRTLLEASELEGMRIEDLEITLLPLPGVQFVMAPTEGPMNEEHDVIYRSVKDLHKLLKD